jgi:hypothetical protein
MADAQQQWLPLDPSEFDDDGEQTINGVLFHLSVSPYDIPLAVRGSYDDKRSRFVIDFKYMAMEDTKERSIEDHVVVRVGKQSGRLYSIEADVKAMEAQAVLLRIDEAFKAAHNPRVKPNYEVAKRIVSDKAHELWGPAPKQLPLGVARGA